MATNWRQQGAVLTAAAPTGGVISGEGVLIGACFGVAAFDALEGAEVELSVEGVWSLPKAAAAVIAFGAPCYWATGTVNGTAGTLIGYCAKAAGSDATIDVRLTPNGAAVVV
jgi:predicted RecA/RadA family phage recombinase